jgi:hypothetical protein
VSVDLRLASGLKKISIRSIQSNMLSRVSPELPSPPPVDLAAALDQLSDATPTSERPIISEELVYTLGIHACAVDRPPSLPAHALRLMELVESADVEVNELVPLIHRDVAMASAVLALANSAAYRTARRITDLRSAVMMIGTQHTAALVAGVAARTLFDPRSKAEHAAFPEVWARLHQRSVAAAFTTAWLAHHMRLDDRDAAFVAGLMRGIGLAGGLRAMAGMIASGALERPDEAVGRALIERVEARAGAAILARLALPAVFDGLCDPVVHEVSEAVHASRLIWAMSSVRAGRLDATAREHALVSGRALGLDPRFIRPLVFQIEEDAARAAALFPIAGN